MSYNAQMTYPSFAENQNLVESSKSNQWGDRLNGLVFIGQNIEKEKLIANLEKCLLKDSE